MNMNHQLLFPNS